MGTMCIHLTRTHALTLLGHAKSICSFSGPHTWKLAALQISRDLKLKALKEKKRKNVYGFWS